MYTPVVAVLDRLGDQSPEARDSKHRFGDHHSGNQRTGQGANYSDDRDGPRAQRVPLSTRRVRIPEPQASACAKRVHRGCHE